MDWRRKLFGPSLEEQELNARRYAQLANAETFNAHWRHIRELEERINALEAKVEALLAGDPK